MGTCAISSRENCYFFFGVTLQNGRLYSLLTSGSCIQACEKVDNEIRARGNCVRKIFSSSRDIRELSSLEEIVG